MSSLLAIWQAANGGDDDSNVPRSRRLRREHPSEAPSRLSPEDAVLVGRLRVGDERAFHECFDIYYADLWRYAARLLASREAAQDVVQDVFTAVFTKREALTVRDAVRTYLFGAVRHAALNRLRHDTVARRVAERAAPNDGAPAMGAPLMRPDQLTEQHDIETRVMRALAGLPERQRSAMILRWEHGLSTAEIARTMGIADTVAGRLLAKAATHLRRQLAEREAYTEK